MHLKPDELVDLAEGARSESSAPHLAVCADCRRELGEMRAMMSAVADVDVPEPSPLFWDHLSARVGDRVASERKPSPAWLDVATWRRVVMPAWAAVVASLIVVAVLGSRLMAPEPPPGASTSATLKGSPDTPQGSPPAVADANASIEVLGDAASDDASLMLVASLTSAMDLDAAEDAGLAPDGSAEHALTQMPVAELRELQRLLKAELVGS
jgi:hypothetical protein